MSAGAVSNKAGPSTPASKDQKAKRPRKRNRNKKRTTEVEDDSSSSSSSSSDDSDDEEPAPKAAPLEVKTSAPADSNSDSDDEDDKDGDGAGGDADGKRKRKRKRTTKKKTADEASKPTAATSTSVQQRQQTAVSTPAKPFTLSAEEIGPDPNTDLRLSDQAKQAIQYAQVYIKDKSQWKFNKAKQNWLLRNALSVPPSDYDSALARKQPDSTASAEAAPEEAEDTEDGENFVPEDFVPVVTAYLTSVMGGARQRLIESLREAINAPAITIAPCMQRKSQITPPTAQPQTKHRQQQVGRRTVRRRSQFHLETWHLNREKKEEAAEAAGLPAGTDPQSVELRRSRATLMLQHMGESL